MEDGAWIEMKESFKKISLATLLFPLLVSQIRDADIREKISIIQTQLVNNQRINPGNLKISEITQTPLPCYLEHYENILEKKIRGSKKILDMDQIDSFPEIPFTF